MKMIFIVFRKELLDTLRDRRTIISMIVVPLLLIPILLSLSTQMFIKQEIEAREKTLKIGLVDAGNAGEFRNLLLADEKIQLIEDLTPVQARSLVESDDLDIYFEVSRDFDRRISGMQPGRITMYYKAAGDRSIEKRRAMAFVDNFEQKLMSDRLRELGIDETAMKTIDFHEQNLATVQEQMAEAIGGLLPYLFIIFCFLGSMYPAMDLAAGEKERGTLETLLTSPAGRFEILLGKFLVVVLTGMLTAIIGIIGLYIGFSQIPEIPDQMLKTILLLLEPGYIIMMLSLLLPLTIFFAALLLSLSIFAKSYKEAQSIISPMFIVVIVPAFLGLLPGVELNTVTAMIPVLNVSLATKAIIAGTITTFDLSVIYVSLVAIAGISLFVCARIFDHEGTIFRGT